MANCTQIAGMELQCESNSGGIKNIFIANRSEINSMEYANGNITGINMVASALFVPFEFRKGGASFTSTLTVDDSTGVNFFTNELTINFARMDAVKRMELVALSKAELVVIFRDNNNVYHFLGMESPVYVSSAQGATGTAKTDANTYQIVLSDESSNCPPSVDTAVIKQVVKGGAPRTVDPATVNETGDEPETGGEPETGETGHLE